MLLNWQQVVRRLSQMVWQLLHGTPVVVPAEFTAVRPVVPPVETAVAPDEKMNSATLPNKMYTEASCKKVEMKERGKRRAKEQRHWWTPWQGSCWERFSAEHRSLPGRLGLHKNRQLGHECCPCGHAQHHRQAASRTNAERGSRQEVRSH